jgi:hypothetical protein
LNNFIDGSFAKMDATTKQDAAQRMISDALRADNTELVNAAHQLSADANNADQSHVNADLANMAQTCSSLGMGPTSSSGSQ